MTDQQFFNIFGFWPNPNPPVPPFGQWVQPYNSQELASYVQARTLVTAINSTLLPLGGSTPIPMGGGVLPGDDEATTMANPPAEPQNTGIYMPTWSNVPGAGPEGSAVGPDGTKYYTLCLRFVNGKVGMNVGLILDKFSRYPLSPNYVIGQIAAEAESAN
jgi:hypothetical protein